MDKLCNQRREEKGGSYQELGTMRDRCVFWDAQVPTSSVRSSVVNYLTQSYASRLVTSKNEDDGLRSMKRHVHSPIYSVLGKSLEDTAF